MAPWVQRRARKGPPLLYLRALLFNLLSWLIFVVLGLLYLPLLLIPGPAGERIMMAAGTIWSRLMLGLTALVVGH